MAVARQRSPRRRTLTLIRGLGVIGVLPLFAAAGSLMLPTVVGGGLAWARHDWRRPTRGICCLVAAGPVLFISYGLVDTFGASARTVGGVVGLLAVYAAIIWSIQPTFAPQADGWSLPRWAKWTIPIIGVVLFAVPLYLGGIN